MSLDQKFRTRSERALGVGEGGAGGMSSRVFCSMLTCALRLRRYARYTASVKLFQGRSLTHKHTHTHLLSKPAGRSMFRSMGTAVLCNGGEA